MSLSIFTSGSAMSSLNALNKSNSMLSTAMERLGTGKRINSAADDAAGMQIASRLQGQSNGMAVAQRNISDATAMLQTAEGAFDEVSNIMYRMKDLATQSANDTNSEDDRKAINAELGELDKELTNIMTNTSFGGDKLFGTSGKLSAGMNFQIGASTGGRHDRQSKHAVGRCYRGQRYDGDYCCYHYSERYRGARLTPRH
ncbi:A-type flagellin [Cedecea neteri]|uniref:A-type flagellin n=1 Tax=Cedecea neteri TaxID=158822 RepID=A0A2X2T356_9ENTR|nr:A-type flagellin [Cedecea neteri]